MDIHGGNLNVIEKKFNIQKENIIDFSDNINPLGASKLLKENMDNIYDLLNIYPDENYEKLRKAIGEYTKTNFENIIVGNGATELISGLIKAVSPNKSLIILPTYSEYEKELKKINSDISYFDVLESEDFKLNIDNLINTITKEIDLLVFCNPNNPTGYLTNISDLRIILEHCKTTNTTVLLDETYIEFSKESTGATSIVSDFDNLFIIRGTSKFFAISGLRLGYGLCSNTLLKEKVLKTLIPWNVNIVADYFGQLIFTDKSFIEESISLCNAEYKKIIDFFNTIPEIKVFESSTNFILFKILSSKFNANDLFEYMIKEGLLIRNLTHSKGLSDKYFRICLQTSENNDKFLKCFKEFLIQV